MATPYQFGCAPGWLGQMARNIAARHGAELVNYGGDRATGPKRHWFVIPQQLGAPFDGAVADAVLADLRAARLIAPEQP